MAKSSTRLVLKSSALFQDMPDEAIEQVAGLAVSRSYSAECVVFRQGDQGDGLYGVVSGKVRISRSSPDGKDFSLNIMEPGSIFGEIALLDGEPRTANATTMVPTELIMIRREHFRELLHREPSIAIHLVELMCKRVRWTSDLVEESTLMNAEARLARRLLTLARLDGVAERGKMVVKISQSDLAGFTGMARQVVNQRLQEWRERGWVSLGRSRITIEDPDALESVE